MRLKALVLAAVLTLGMTATAFAGTWKKGVVRPDEWWYDYGNGTYAANQWVWIDGNGDGLAECYYFDKDGWMMRSQESPDHWVTNGSASPFYLRRRSGFCDPLQLIPQLIFGTDTN